MKKQIWIFKSFLEKLNLRLKSIEFSIDNDIHSLRLNFNKFPQKLKREVSIIIFQIEDLEKKILLLKNKTKQLDKEMNLLLKREEIIKYNESLIKERKEKEKKLKNKY